MRHHFPGTPIGLSRTLFCAALCLCSAAAQAEKWDDPFGTEALLPAKPALRQGDEDSDPCAQVMPSGTLNLLDVVNLALCRNPQTREVWASARVQAAQVGVNKAGYLPSPTLNASGNRSWTDGLSGASQRSLGLSLAYLLYDFGTRAANLENARQLLEAASATQDSTIQTVFLAAVQSYYQNQATRAALDAAHESEHATQESLSAAEARYQAGSATPADKLQAQTAHSQAMLMAPNSSAQELNIFERDVGALIEEARRRRPDLYAAAAQLKAAEATVDAARASGKPSVSLTASTTHLNSAGTSSRGSSAGISLTVPIFSGFAPTYRIRAAEAQVEAKAAQLDKLNLQIALDVWTAYQNLVTATQSLRTTADLLNSAEQSERVALARYKAGAGNMLDVLNAQSTLASARQQRIQATLNWNIGRAALAQTMGSLDEGLLQTLPDVSQPTSPQNGTP
ncbi:MAG: TolC family protein [Nitrosomonadales bacterium]|nr:TolC family protein [Nitrosomonadales bacterium]